MIPMPSPFPGMNPYLEQSESWAEFHHWLIIEIARSLNPKLRPNYFVAVEQRVYESPIPESMLVGIPDNIVVSEFRSSRSSSIATASPVVPIQITLPISETIKEGYLEVRKVGTGQVITAIEILSPENKRAGRGRKKYDAKRRRVLASATHLVEIDLLRKGRAFTPLTLQSHYRILVSRSDRRPQADLYAFNLPDVIPAFPLPLQPDDTEPLLDLQALLQEVYDQAGYDLRLDYHSLPELGLNDGDRLWVEEWLTHAGLRP
jgi:Protein of unknown function (DUF4058)